MRYVVSVFKLKKPANHSTFKSRIGVESLLISFSGTPLELYTTNILRLHAKSIVACFKVSSPNSSVILAPNGKMNNVVNEEMLRYSKIF